MTATAETDAAIKLVRSVAGKRRRRLACAATLAARVRESDEVLRPERDELWRELLDELGMTGPTVAAACGVEPITVYKAVQRARPVE